MTPGRNDGDHHDRTDGGDQADRGRIEPTLAEDDRDERGDRAVHSPVAKKRTRSDQAARTVTGKGLAPAKYDGRKGR